MDEENAIMNIIEGTGNIKKNVRFKNLFTALEYYFGVDKWCEDCLEFLFSGAGGENLIVIDEERFQFCLYMCSDCLKLTNYKNYKFRHTVI